MHLERKGLLARPVLLGPGPEEPRFQRTRLWRLHRPELVLLEPLVRLEQLELPELPERLCRA